MDTTEDKPTDRKGRNRYDKLNLVAECATLFGTEYYHSFIPSVEDILRMSRDREYYKHPEKHLGLQMGILEAVARVEQAASEGKKLAREKGDDAIRSQSQSNKLISKAYRQIADGIAWRSLGFSRFTIRVLSQAQSPGAAWGKDAGRDEEMRRAVNVVRHGSYVLLHDATNCLRVGDLSSMDAIPSNKPWLAEVKKKELITAGSVHTKIKANKKTDKQEFRLFQAQVMLTDRMFVLEQDIPVVQIPANHIDHIAAAGAVMKKAMKQGAASKMIAPYMFMEALDIPVLMQAGGYQEKMDSISHPDLTGIAQQSNYDYLQLLRVGELARNVTPYTIFPLPLQTVAKLITGELFVTATVYLEPLQAEFARFGWNLEMDEAALNTYEQTDENERVQFFSDELLFSGEEAEAEWLHLKNPRNGFIFPVSAMIARMPHEFTSVRHIVAVAEEVMKLCTPGEETALYPDLLEGWRWL